MYNVNMLLNEKILVKHTQLPHDIVKHIIEFSIIIPCLNTKLKNDIVHTASIIHTFTYQRNNIILQERRKMKQRITKKLLFYTKK
jgi:hypothetical protein